VKLASFRCSLRGRSRNVLELCAVTWKDQEDQPLAAPGIVAGEVLKFLAGLRRQGGRASSGFRALLVLVRSASEVCWTEGWGRLRILRTRNFGIANPQSEIRNPQWSNRRAALRAVKTASFP